MRRYVPIALAIVVLSGAVVVLLRPHTRSTRNAVRDALPPTPTEVVARPGMSTLPSPTPPPPTPVTPPPSQPSADLALVINAGGSPYVVIDDISNVPRHGPARLDEDNGISVAIAAVAPRDVPANVRTLLRDGVIVDGNCKARVEGYAVIARIRGEDLDDEGRYHAWTANSVMERGSPRLAARLDSCAGTYARPAKHPPVEILAEADDPAIDVVRERFVQSQLVEDAQRAWHDADNDGDWYEGDGAHLVVRAFVHPRTGETWVLAHAYRYNDCGQQGGNVVAVYRVSGKTVALVKARTGGAERYEGLIDVDGDGGPELVVASDTDPSVERIDGESIVSLGALQVGCGC